MELTLRLFVQEARPLIAQDGRRCLKKSEAQTSRSLGPRSRQRLKPYRHGANPRDSHAREAGFLLPLSIMGALLLFTSTVALSLADLQTSQAQAVEEERNSDNDQLISAAHVIAGYLQNSKKYSCLRQYKLSTNPTCSAWASTFPKLTSYTNEFLNTPYAALPLTSRRITITNWDPKNSGGTSGLLSLATEDGNQKKDFYINFGTGGQRSAISDESQAQT
jgi:hypothetical protein